MSDLTYRPKGARIVAYGVVVLLLVLTVLLSRALPHYAVFTFSQKATIGVLLAFVIAVMHGVGRSYVRLAADAVVVRNGYRTHVVAWTDAAGILAPGGAPWPTLVTKADERVMLFAIQRSDGTVAEQAVAELRGRLR